MSLVKEVLSELAENLNKAYEQGAPFHILGNGARPDFVIHSLNPIGYEELGKRDRRRGPRLLGAYAVEDILWQEFSNTFAKIVGVVPTTEKRYGLYLPPKVVDDAFRFAHMENAAFGALKT